MPSATILARANHYPFPGPSSVIRRVPSCAWPHCPPLHPSPHASGSVICPQGGVPLAKAACVATHPLRPGLLSHTRSPSSQACPLVAQCPRAHIVVRRHGNPWVMPARPDVPVPPYPGSLPSRPARNSLAIPARPCGPVPPHDPHALAFSPSARVMQGHACPSGQSPAPALVLSSPARVTHGQACPSF